MIWQKIIWSFVWSAVNLSDHNEIQAVRDSECKFMLANVQSMLAHQLAALSERLFKLRIWDHDDDQLQSRIIFEFDKNGLNSSRAYAHK